MTTTDLEQQRRLGTGRVVQATGVVSRYLCDTEDQISLAVTACRAALDDAGLSADQIDLLVFGAAVPYQPIPATAPLVMRRLAMADGTAAAFDVNATCLSFITAFDLAARQIATGVARRALVVSSEVASRALPWDDDPETAALFGDGAAAMVLGASPPRAAACVAAMQMRSYPSAYEACTLGAGGTRFDYHKDPAGFAANSTFDMDGKALFRVTAQHFKGFVADLLVRAGWRQSDVALVVPHQASPAGLAHMIRLTGFAPRQVVDIAAEYGNQVAASIPFAYDLARRDGRIAAGDKVLMLGTSAGVSFGGLALVA
ncbi:3-oxoacyl-ACP synthase III family protein [Yoonia vestfoldensis]|uniref:3-oxoacyl-ACP synthase III family protein n=1 Tax=Yoonia vestfoldensis TaxID=245188 RepID=UPI001FDEF47F|nr:3-oxoacyl-[acyl-carrier-protein] synthase III C-terminal domain-containing protein [Yoonia vestfoldensis]